MAIQIVMDRNGDTRHHFDCNDAEAVASAENLFLKLTSQGYRAVALAENDEPGELLSSFDAKTKRMLFIPQLKGG